jgi:hypothetical protein
MGLSYYFKNIDKNSGMTEVEIISKELGKIKTDKKVLVIINGLRDNEDNNLFDYMKNYDLTIFIMSDSIALETSLDIMNACDVVLHQAPNYIFKEIKAKQYYSYVPELFYKYCKETFMHKSNIIANANLCDIYFGGNNKNRDDKFKAYRVAEAASIFSRYKLYETGEDSRISHKDYLNELLRFAYSLVICRKDYRDIGWITSRYFEAIALDNIPLIDFEYDKHNFLVEEDSILRVKDYDSLIFARDYLCKHPIIAAGILVDLKRNAEKNIEEFRMLIEEIINYEK